MATIVSMASFLSKRAELEGQTSRSDEQMRLAQEKFVMESLAASLDNARNLPRVVAIELLRKIMLVHYIDKEEI